MQEVQSTRWNVHLVHCGLCIAAPSKKFLLPQCTSRNARDEHSISWIAACAYDLQLPQLAGVGRFQLAVQYKPFSPFPYNWRKINTLIKEIYKFYYYTHSFRTKNWTESRSKRRNCEKQELRNYTSLYSSCIAIYGTLVLLFRPLIVSALWTSSIESTWIICFFSSVSV